MKRVALVVDDSTSMRRMVAFTLQEAGFAVCEGENGEVALSRLDASAVDIVITDLNMPVMDGITLTRSIRGRAAHRLTPFNPQQLLQVIRRVLP